MTEELIAAIGKLTTAAAGIGSALWVLVLVLILKETDAKPAIRDLTHEIDNLKCAIYRLKD